MRTLGPCNFRRPPSIPGFPRHTARTKKYNCQTVPLPLALTFRVSCDTPDTFRIKLLSLQNLKQNVPILNSKLDLLATAICFLRMIDSKRSKILSNSTVTNKYCYVDI